MKTNSRNYNSRLYAILKVLKLISQFYFSDVPFTIRRNAIKELFSCLKILVKSRGIVFATQYLKGVRGACTKFLCKEP